MYPQSTSGYLDIFGNPIERGGMRRVGPGMKYHHPSGKFRAASSLSTTGPSAIDKHKAKKGLKPMVEANHSVKRQQQTRNPSGAVSGGKKETWERGNNAPGWTGHPVLGHRRIKLDTGWWDSKWEPLPGPYAHTEQRGFQTWQEERLAREYFENIEQLRDETAMQGRSRDQKWGNIRGQELQALKRLGTPDKDDVPPVEEDWGDIMKTKTRHGYVPSTQRTATTNGQHAPDAAALKRQLIGEERIKRHMEVASQQERDGIKPPVLNQSFVDVGAVPHRAVEKKLKKRAMEEPRKNPRELAQESQKRVDAAYKEEFDRQMSKMNMGGGAAKPTTTKKMDDQAALDFREAEAQARYGAVDLLTLGSEASEDKPNHRHRGPRRDVEKVRPSEAPAAKILGTIPVAKAYPYQRQKARRRELDEVNLKQALVSATNRMDSGEAPSGDPGSSVQRFYEVSRMSPDRKRYGF